MRTKTDMENDPSRLAIAVFIVATTLTVAATHFSVPTVLFIPIGAFLLGLIVSAILAFLFILAKGYELRYGKKGDTLVDKYNYILYNSALTAYVIIMVIILFAFVFKNLNQAADEGNIWASVGIGVLFIIIIGIINGRDIKELSVAAGRVLKNRLHKNK